MADDIQDANGQWLAADDLGDGRKIPRVKLAAGADGEAADISEANPLFVQIAGASGGTETDLSIVLYRVKTAFTGASIGDTVTATRAITVEDDSVTQVGSTLWRNESTDAVLASAPSAATLEAVGATGLTAAQLTAAGLATQTTLAGVLSALQGTLAVNPTTDGETVAALADGAGVQQAVTGTTSTFSLPTLGASRRVRIRCSVATYLQFATSGSVNAEVAGTSIPFEANAPEYVVIPAGMTHFAAIREGTTSGTIHIQPTVD